MKTAEFWERRELASLALIDNESLSEDTRKDFDFYYIDIGCVSEGNIRIPTNKISFREAPSRARKVVHRGDVLMSTVRPNLKAFAFFDHTDDDCIASTGFAVLTAHDWVDPRFILYALLSEDVTSQIEACLVGSNYPAINTNSVRGLQILTPSFDEQTKIAEILSTVDRSIEQTEALIAKQQRIKTGLMHDLLTRGIDEQGNLRSEETHQFKDSPLGRIPIEWDVVPLSLLADAIDPQPDHRTPPEVPDGIPYIGVSDFHSNGSIDFEGARLVPEMVLRKQQKSFEIGKGDFVFGKIGTIGSPRRLPTFEEYALSANVILLRPRETPSFVYWWMASPIVKRLVDLEIHSTSQPAFGIQKMRALKIPNPSNQERQRIGDVFDELELHGQTVAREMSKLQANKIALMQDLLTGKKCVTTLLNETEVMSG